MGRKSIKVLRTNRILSTGVHIYSDRGEKFDSQLLNSCFDVFIITHLLRNKLFPYDVEVAEATFKTEFIKNKKFGNTNKLHQRFSAYVHWYNIYDYHLILLYEKVELFQKI